MSTTPKFKQCHLYRNSKNIRFQFYFTLRQAGELYVLSHNNCQPDQHFDSVDSVLCWAFESYLGYCPAWNWSHRIQRVSLFYSRCVTVSAFAETETDYVCVKEMFNYFTLGASGFGLHGVTIICNLCSFADVFLRFRPTKARTIVCPVQAPFL